MEETLPNNSPRPIRFDRELVRRYDVSGPRYTSYPTALQFTEAFGESDFRRAVAHSNEDPIPRPLSLYVHVPFCASPCFYCGCTKVITRDTRRANVYLAHLDSEFDAIAGIVDDDRLVKQLHFGGGTPTFLSIAQLDQLLAHMAGRYSFSAGLECAIEIDPRTVSPDQVRQLGESGFNRMSLGVQDFDPEVQKAVNRIQPVEDTVEVIRAASETCSRGVNVDLIYGLPKQTVTSFDRSLETLIEARPTRVAAYGYAHLPHLFKPQTRIREEELPSAEEKLALLELTIDRLTSAGYVYIGMDHFALPHDDLVRAMEAGRLNRNFQGYSTQAQCDTLAFGMSAIGDVGGVFSQNHKDIIRYQNSIARGSLPVSRGYVPTSDDRVRRAVIHDIMCRGMVDFRELESRFELRVDRYFASELKHLEELDADGLVVMDRERFRVTGAGRLLLRAVAMVFDAWLQHGRTGVRQFSRVV